MTTNRKSKLYAETGDKIFFLCQELARETKDDLLPLSLVSDVYCYIAILAGKEAEQGLEKIKETFSINEKMEEIYYKLEKKNDK